MQALNRGKCDATFVNRPDVLVVIAEPKGLPEILRHRADVTLARVLADITPARNRHARDAGEYLGRVDALEACLVVDVGSIGPDACIAQVGRGPGRDRLAGGGVSDSHPAGAGAIRLR